MTHAAESTRRRARLQFLALAAIFLGPVAVAAWMYYGSHMVPGHHVNHGALMPPGTVLPSAALATPAGGRVEDGFLRRRWSLVYLVGDRCAEACKADLAELKKVRLAMDHERDRVQRVLLGHAPCCAADSIGGSDPDLTVGYLDGAEAAALSALLPTPGAGPRDVYVVDPLGNLVMRFPGEADRKGLIKDLDKLLRLSHIG